MSIWTCCFILWCLSEDFRTWSELRSALFVAVSASGPTQRQHLFIGDSCDLRTSILHVSFCLHHFLSGRWALVLLGLHPLVLLSLGGSGFCKMAALQSEGKSWCVTKVSSGASVCTWNLGVFPGFSHHPPRHILSRVPAVDDCPHWSCYQRPHLNPRAESQLLPDPGLPGRSTAWPKIEQITLPRTWEVTDLKSIPDCSPSAQVDSLRQCGGWSLKGHLHTAGV